MELPIKVSKTAIKAMVEQGMVEDVTKASTATIEALMNWFYVTKVLASYGHDGCTGAVYALAPKHPDPATRPPRAIAVLAKGGVYYQLG